MRSFARALWLVIIGLFGFCAYSHPRFWWQELLMCSAGFWGLLVLMRLLFRLFQVPWRRKEPLGWYTLTALASEGAIILALLPPVLPYLAAEGGLFNASITENASRTRVLWCYTRPDPAHQERCQGVARAHQADVVVFEGKDPMGLTDLFPHKVVTPSVNGIDGFVLYSKLPIVDSSVTDLGVAALPGMYVGLMLPEGRQIQIGMLALQDGWTQQRFAQNKLSARRLATLSRNSVTPRLILGRGFGPPFSGLSQLYWGQARLVPAIEEIGLSSDTTHPFWLLERIVSPSSNLLFVSKGSSTTPAAPKMRDLYKGVFIDFLAG